MDFYEVEDMSKRPVIRKELVGRLKVKYWQLSKDYNEVLFKPMLDSNKKRKNPKFYANHFGEKIGSEILKKSGFSYCRCKLATSEYYTRQIDGCIIYDESEKGDSLTPGEIAIHSLYSYKKLAEPSTKECNNVENIIEAVRFHSAEEDLEENERDIFSQIIFDCLYANPDRHDENWSILNRANNGRA